MLSRPCTPFPYTTPFRSGGGLRGDMRLFRGLRLLQRHVRPRPISAAILHVRVEEEAVEVVADVVMMLDVGARPALTVDRADPRRHPFGAPPEPALVEQIGRAHV